MILAENGVRASSSLVEGPVLDECLDCGDAINQLRKAALQKVGMKCMYCITCQPKHDKAGGIKMLDRIL